MLLFVPVVVGKGNPSNPGKKEHAYVIALKVGAIHTGGNENNKQPWGFARQFLKNKLDRL